DTAGRNTDQDGDLPVWIVLPPSGTGHSQGDREAVPDQGMPTHGSLAASESLYLGNRGSAWTCKVLALSPLVRLNHARSTSTAGIAGARAARTQPCVSIHQLGARGLDYFGPERSLRRHSGGELRGRGAHRHHAELVEALAPHRAAPGCAPPRDGAWQ